MGRGRLAVCLFLAVVVVSLGATAVGRGDEVKPEVLLGEKSVAYLRFDGFKEHRDELDKTILAQLLAEDLHPLLSFVRKLALDSVGPDVIAERLLAGLEPGQLIELQKSAKQLPILLELFLERGVVVGVEAMHEPTPGAQATLVFPGAGEAKHRDAIFAGVRILASLNDRKLKEVTKDGRTMLQMTLGGPVLLHCWQEGEHVVTTIGTAPPENTIAQAKGQRRNLTVNPLFQQVGEFDDYETYARAFFDTKGGMEFARGLYPPAGKLLDELGVSGMTSLTLQFGCHDELLRNTVTLNTTEERKGILAVFTAPADLKLESLPPIAPDASMTVAVSIDSSAVYDGAINVLGKLVQFADPEKYEDFKSDLEKFEQRLGGDIRRDLREALGSTVVSCVSPSEGSLVFGTALAFEVKDAERLDKTIRRLFRVLAEYAGTEVNIRESPYRDGKLSVMEFDAQQFPFTPTYTIHNGWFVIGITPAVAQGYILRSSGKYATWKPAPLFKAAIESEKQQRTADGSKAKLFAVTQIDPRPTVAAMISYAPLLFAIGRANPSSGLNFDPTLIPNAQAITERLSPNTAVVVDDGKSIRIETYDTLPMPIDLSGIAGVYGPLLLFSFQF